MDKGIYCLVVKNPACTVEVGALGPLSFAAGWHGYVGSALGLGGLVRLERHLRLAELRDRQPKWHIDYLLSDPRFSVAYAVSAPTVEQLECLLAATLARDGTGVDRFGCSDCDCPSHLLHWRRDPKERIVTAFAGLGLVPGIKTIITPKGKGNV
ncbi:GIY-YIG nuclease family protein [Methanoregula sp.]|uniref:GIY-YIG nuclease family protein n=1 Tax=Methanoregula sp. TaxID=2052170 RepID=UPI002C054927|nr:GIY-YIG nuclease family protein [Methanoregula sp.]HVP95745.1 GIY-YIG nuclease family protein [Methanoregula sp.]